MLRVYRLYRVYRVECIECHMSTAPRKVLIKLPTKRFFHIYHFMIIFPFLESYYIVGVILVLGENIVQAVTKT